VKTVVGTLPPLSAVTYISLSTGLSVVSTGVAVRLLPVDKIEPESPTVKDGRYPLRRPILLLSKKEANPPSTPSHSLLCPLPGKPSLLKRTCRCRVTSRLRKPG
jgi:hypothetical protein